MRVAESKDGKKKRPLFRRREMGNEGRADFRLYAGFAYSEQTSSSYCLLRIGRMRQSMRSSRFWKELEDVNTTGPSRSITFGYALSLRRISRASDGVLIKG